MRALLVAVLIAAGLSGCSRGPSCADLTTQLQTVKYEIASGQFTSSFDGGVRLQAALAKQQSLTDAFVSKGCSS